MATELEQFRKALLSLPDTGEAGFEGLMQTTLSRWTGLRFYGARAGRQDGRDGGTGPGSLDIVYESKLYRKAGIKERELLGEIARATQTCPDLDLYVVATTATMPDLTQRTLCEEAEKKDIELLLLDWDPAGPPMLAVFLAKQRDNVLAWFRQYSSAVRPDEIKVALDEILAHPAANSVANQIAAQLARETLGEARLRDRLRTATLKVLAERGLARRKFGQFLTPLDSGARAIVRPRFTDAVANWWANPDTRILLSLVGSEGTGKSWIVPQWWASLPPEEAPALVIVPSWRLRGHTDAVDGTTLLADAIAWLTTDSPDPKSVLATERRLKRWANRAGEKPRWVVVLDGANEATQHPWARTLDNLAPIMEKLAGRVVLTSRQEFWCQEIEPRLFEFRPTKIQVTDFDDEELDRALALRPVKANELPPQVRDVIRNPRMLSVADTLWPEVGTAAVTRDRLLYNYWRLRMQERGSFIAHNETDMRALLIKHAKEIRAGVINFAVDKWKDYSGAGSRLTPQAIQDDLTEIVDGRFFGTDGDLYMPKETALPFALGLLLARELRDETGATIEAVIDSAIDPIHGEDRTADILASATALSLMDSAPTAVSLALLRRWIGLQNVPDAAFQDVSAYVPTAPKVYLDLIEELYADPLHPRLEWIPEALRQHRDEPSLHDDLISRLNRWMGYWSLDKTLWLGFGSSHGERRIREENVRHRSRVQRTLSELTAEERSLFDQLCAKVENLHLPQVAALVEHIAAGWILAPLAKGVLAWCLAAEVGHRVVPESSVAWLFDMNFTDFAATRVALVAEAIRALAVAQCRQFRNAAARVYGFAGLPEDTAQLNDLYSYPPERTALLSGSDLDRAEYLFDTDPLDGASLVPTSVGRSSDSSWLEYFCDTDPLDPASPLPTYLARAEAEIDRISGERTRLLLYADHLDKVVGALARFSQVPILALWRRALDTFAVCPPFVQWQLILVLPEISPLLKPTDLATIESLLIAMNDPKHALNGGGDNFVPRKLLEAVLPHLRGEEQLSLLRKLSQVANLNSENLLKYFRPVEASFFESQLRGAFAESRDALLLVLFFGARIAQPLADDAVEIVGLCLEHDDHDIRALAFELTWRSMDERLLEKIRRFNWSANTEPHQISSHYGSLALAVGASHSGEPVAFERISPNLWGYAAALSDQPDATQIYASFFGELAMRMAQSQIEALPPAIVRHARGARAPQDVFAYCGKRREEGDFPLLHPMASKILYPQFLRPQRDLVRRELDAFGEALRNENLTALWDFPWMSGFQNLIGSAPEQLIRLARKLLTITEQAHLTRLKNWVLAMIPALSITDSALAVSLYRHVKELRAFVGLISGPAEIPFEFDVLMTAEQEAFADERINAFIHAGNDEQIALLVLSAEKNGRGAWLRDFARACIGETQPGRVALGMTISGLCNETAVPSEILGYKYKIGNLAVSATFATRASERNVWARHWQDRARKATDPVIMWRFGELMVRSADHRWTLWFDPAPETPDRPWARYAQTYEERLWQRGKKKADERKKTLYGREPPSRLLASLLNRRVSRNGIPSQEAIT